MIAHGLASPKAEVQFMVTKTQCHGNPSSRENNAIYDVFSYTRVTHGLDLRSDINKSLSPSVKCDFPGMLADIRSR